MKILYPQTEGRLDSGRLHYDTVVGLCCSSLFGMKNPDPTALQYLVFEPSSTSDSKGRIERTDSARPKCSLDVEYSIPHFLIICCYSSGFYAKRRANKRCFTMTDLRHSHRQGGPVGL